MTTAIVHIMKGEDRLTMEQFSELRWNVVQAAHDLHAQVIFEGKSTSEEGAPSMCWILQIGVDDVNTLSAGLEQLSAIYGQDSISLTLGENRSVESPG